MADGYLWLRDSSLPKQILHTLHRQHLALCLHDPCRPVPLQPSLHAARSPPRFSLVQLESNRTENLASVPRAKTGGPRSETDARKAYLLGALGVHVVGHLEVSQTRAPCCGTLNSDARKISFPMKKHKINRMGGLTRVRLTESFSWRCP